MAELREINNQQLLKELKQRVISNKISEERVFKFLNSPLQRVITEYEIVDLDKLNKNILKKAYQALDKDKIYQDEVKLWENTDND